MVTMSASRAVLGKLGINGNLTPSLVPTVTFSPTLGIAAGRIDKLGLDIRSFKEPLTRAIREVMVPSIKRNFSEGGRPAWEPLSEATMSIRAWKGVGGSSPLISSGLLARTASQINIWDVNQTSAVIRDLPDKVWYGKIHQGGYDGGSMSSLIKKFGGDVGAASAAHTAGLISGASSQRTAAAIPARPFLVYQDEDEDGITQVFIDWLEERIQRAWPSVGI